MAENGLTEDQYTPEEEALSAYSAFFTLLLQLTLTVIHGLRLYSDFCTTERKVLDYRKAKPRITAGYKRIAYLTYASICFFTLLLLAEVIQYNFTVGECETMFAVQVIDKIGYFGAKASLYLVFVLRLHQVYGSSVYGYSKKKLFCVGITIIVSSVSLFILLQIWTILWPVYVDDTDTLFPFFCQIFPAEPYLFLIAGLMVLFDLTACIIAIIAFIVPLNKVIKAWSEFNGKNKKRFQKMMRTGSKFKILVIASATSTLLWVVLVLSGSVAPATIIGQLDFWINPLCLVLMTPYYPSKQYYERFCYLCIICCDRNRKLYENEASDEHDSENTDRAERKDNIDSMVMSESRGDSAYSKPTNPVSVDTDVALQTKLSKKASAQEMNADFGGNTMDDSRNEQTA